MRQKPCTVCAAQRTIEKESNPSPLTRTGSPVSPFTSFNLSPFNPSPLIFFVATQFAKQIETTA